MLQGRYTRNIVANNNGECKYTYKYKNGLNYKNKNNKRNKNSIYVSLHAISLFENSTIYNFEMLLFIIRLAHNN